VTPADLQTIAAVVQARSGQVIGADKAYLIESRLGPLTRKEGFASVADLAQALRLRRDEALSAAVADAMLNAETWFFRERPCFELLRDQLFPALGADRGGQLRVWSAGCSTGQEPYSLALAGEEAAAGYRLDIVATDMSRRLLEKAHSGLYTQFEVQRGLPIRTLIRHFVREDEHWRLSPRLRQAVRFRLVNLLEDTRPLGRFDVILCRNVVSGMDPKSRAAVLERLWGQLADDGMLLLGGTETLSDGDHRFRAVAGRQGLYVKAAPRRAAA
jgi:chemotaxis protein methyltransferase CheR